MIGETTFYHFVRSSLLSDSVRLHDFFFKMTVIVLGAGIGGLATANYLLKSQAHKVIVVEVTNRVGGWINSEKQPNGVIFEQGPRTLRPRGEAGVNTLQLIQELGLTNDVRPIRSSAPAARNRYVYANKKLYALPTGVKPLVRAVPPFSKPLINALWHDFVSVPKYVDDDSIYNFVERRFGKEFADYLISPLICGICGGDAKRISVKFLLNKFFEKEQEYGSVIKYYLRPWNWKIIGKYNLKEFGKLIFETRFEDELWKMMSTMDKRRNSKSQSSKNELTLRAKKEEWSSYSFVEGLEMLPLALEEKIRVAGGTFMMNSKPVKLNLRERRLIFQDDEISFDFIVSAIPPYFLAPLLIENNYTLSKLLSDIPHTSIITVNLLYKKKLLNIEGFGFLVPPSENLPILGVIFDHSYAPVQDWTILTVMMGGHAFDKFFKDNCNGDFIKQTAVQNISNILDIDEKPDLCRISILRDCIPQHLVNHHTRITWIMNHIELEKLPLFLVGNAFKGTGINDVILSAKETAETIENLGKSIPNKHAKPRFIVDYL